MTRSSLLLGLAPALLAITSVAALEPADPGSDWPHWRGPNRDGVSPERGWKSEGAAEPLWTRAVGLGYSSPSVAGGRLYTRGFLEKEEVDATFCLDAATGEELWRYESPARKWDNMHGGGTLTTPTVDGDVVYVLSRMGPLLALDAESGELIWERKLDDEFELSLGPFGFSSSPLVVDDLLILNVGKTIALKKQDGEMLWATRDYSESYSTPAPFEHKGRELLAVFNGAGLVVLEQASGKEVALYEWKSEYNVNSATPIVVDGDVFISTGYNEKGCALLRLTPGGLSVVWEGKQMSNKMTGCVLVDGLLYGFDRAELKCLGWDGEERWSQRGLGMGTVIASDDRLIVLSEEGELLIAPASGEGFEPVYRARVFEEGPCWTTPVMAGGRIYLRNSLGELVCRDHRGS